MKIHKILLFVILSSCAQPVGAQLLEKIKKAAKVVENTVSNSIDDLSAEKKKITEKAKVTEKGTLEFARMKIEFKDKNLRDFSAITHNGLPVYWSSEGYFPSGAITSTEAHAQRAQMALTKVKVYEHMLSQKVSPFEEPQVYNDICDLNKHTNDFLIRALVDYFFTAEANQKYFGGQQAHQWGSSQATEFERRRLYEDFIASGILEKLIQKADMLPLEAYVMQAYRLPEYDFNKKGYLITSDKLYYRNDNIDRPYNLNNERESFILELSPEKAEALVNRLKNNPKYEYGNSVYLVQKIEFIKTNKSLYEYNSGPKALNNRIALPIIDVYEDVNLKKKIGEINISKLLKESELYADSPVGPDAPLKLITIDSKDEALKSFQMLAYQGIPILGEHKFMEELSQGYFAPGANPIKFNYFGHLLNFSSVRNAAKLKSESGKPTIYMDNRLYLAAQDLLTENTLKSMDWEFDKSPHARPNYISRENLSKAIKLQADKKLEVMAESLPMEVYILWRADAYQTSRGKPGEIINYGPHVRRISYYDHVGFFSRNGIMSVKKEGLKNTPLVHAFFQFTPQMSERLESPGHDYNNMPIYYVYTLRKVRLIPSDINTEYSHDLKRFYSSFVYEPVDNVIELYEDKYLTRKLTQITSPPKK